MDRGPWWATMAHRVTKSRTRLSNLAYTNFLSIWEPDEFIFNGLYSPWGHKESNTTKQLSLSLSFEFISKIWKYRVKL